jgi:hypothetical protein
MPNRKLIDPQGWGIEASEIRYISQQHLGLKGACRLLNQEIELILVNIKARTRWMKPTFCRVEVETMVNRGF